MFRSHARFAAALTIVLAVMPFRSQLSELAVADELVLSQPAHFSDPFGAWTSDVSLSNEGWQVVDNFRLLAGGEVTQFKWQGMYLDFQTRENNPAAPDTVSWDLTFFADDGGLPGNTLYSLAYSPSEIVTKSRGTTQFDGVRVPVFDYTANLTSPFTAAANAPYWVSVRATSASDSGFNPLWAWTSGGGDDSQIVHRYFPNGGPEFRGTDMAFEMYGTLAGELPSSGQRPDALSRFDQVVQEYMQTNTIESGMLGIMRNGKFLFQRGYGWHDEAHQTPMAEDALMRIASISKPITAATVRKLSSEGLLRLSDRVFDLGQPEGGILVLEPFGGLVDERLKNVRVIDLLRHRGGWDRSVSPDYAFWDLEIAQAMGIDSPPGPENKARFILGQPLDHDPARVNAYSNVGYMMLGLVIEKVTGQDYQDVVHERIFEPLGVPRSEVALGRTFVEDRDPREPWYDQPASWSATNVFDPEGDPVPIPDGGWDQEGAESFGGLIASTKALLAFADNYVVVGDEIGRERRGNEGQSWNWLHTGNLVGTNSVLWQRGDGTSFALVFNRRPNHREEFSIGAGQRLNELVLDPSIQWPDELIFPGDGNGDGWVTPADVGTFSQALIMTAAEFTAAFPEGHFAALDLTADGDVAPADLPLLYSALLQNHNQADDLPFVVGDLNHDWQLDVTDVDLLTEAIAKQLPVDDVDGAEGLTIDDLRVMVKQIFQTSFGDANLDGVFNSGDFVAVFLIGEYEDQTQGNSTWSEGDWNADGDFTTGDFVTAFLDGGYEQPSNVDFATVPEPAGSLLFISALIGLSVSARRNRRQDSPDVALPSVPHQAG